MSDSLPYRFKKVDNNHYEVSVFGAVLGCVYYLAEAWSYGRWFIEGKPVVRTTGGYTLGPARGDRHTAPKKPHGWETRLDATEYLAMMQSGVILRALPEGA